MRVRFCIVLRGLHNTIVFSIYINNNAHKLSKALYTDTLRAAMFRNIDLPPKQILTKMHVHAERLHFLFSFCARRHP